MFFVAEELESIAVTEKKIEQEENRLAIYKQEYGEAWPTHFEMRESSECQPQERGLSRAYDYPDYTLEDDDWSWPASRTKLPDIIGQLKKTKSFKVSQAKKDLQKECVLRNCSVNLTYLKSAVITNSKETKIIVLEFLGL